MQSMAHALQDTYYTFQAKMPRKCVFMSCNCSGVFIVWPTHPLLYQGHPLKQERGLRLLILYHVQAAKRSMECGYV